MLSHTIISAGLARTTAPTVSTAAYALALSVASMAEAPLVMIRQTTMAFVRSRQTFRVVRSVSLISVGVFALIVTAVAYQPSLGRLVFQRLLGVGDELLASTLHAFRIVMFFPIASGLRCVYQGVITVRRRTAILSIAMICRVLGMSLLILGFTRYGWVTGSWVGGLTLLTGLLIEGSIAFFSGQRLVPEGSAEVRYKEVWRFYLPLVASALLVSMGKPFINAALARMPDSAVGLAAFSIASSLAWVFISAVQTLHQVVMVFARDLEGQEAILRFIKACSIVVTAVLCLVAYSPLGNWVFTNLIGAPAETLSATLAATRTLAWFPLIIGWVEYSTGLLLLEQSTRVVSLAKTINLGGTIIFVLLLGPRLPGAVAAPLAQLFGFACEGAVLYAGRWLLARNVNRRIEQLTG